jgi:hypothetical protein
MLNRTYLACSVALAFLPSIVMAASTVASPLATITNSRNHDVSQLSAIVDAQATVQAIGFDTLHNDQNPPTRTSLRFPMSAISQGSGIVLDSEDGHKAILLRGQIDSAAGRGMLVISYLNNGLFGSFTDCNINAIRGNDGVWHLQNAYNQQIVQSAHVVTYALGISTIQNICP